MAAGAKEKAAEFFGGLGAAIAAIAVFAFVLWMSGFFSMFGGSAPISSGEVDGNERPVLEAVEPDPVPPEPAPVLSNPGRWDCFWDPTMNEDWHDDVLCVLGDQHDRPYLLPDWDFVTQDDMLAEAQYYEDWLNSQLPSSGLVEMRDRAAAGG